MIHNLAVRRPILMTTVLAALTIVGVFALFRLPFSLYPEKRNPRVTVNLTTTLASPEACEQTVTSKVEEEIGKLPGVTSIQSHSHAGYASVQVEFSPRTNMKLAHLLLREHLSLLRRQLPELTGYSVVNWVPDEFTNENFMRLALYGSVSPQALSEYYREVLQPAISAVNGVGDVQAGGDVSPVLRITLLPRYRGQVSAEDLADAIRATGRDYSLTGVPWEGQAAQLRLQGRLNSVRQLQDLPVLHGGAGYRLADLASIEQTVEEPAQHYRYNGLPMIDVVLQKNSDANAVRLARRVQAAVNRLELPEGVRLKVLENEAESITTELNKLYVRSGFCLLLILMVLLFFLRDARSSVFVLGSIFFSLTAAFALMYVTRVGLNIMSLAGLTFGFGIMVDNSIVVHEAILANRGRGLKLADAVRAMGREVALPLVACTVTTLVVFLPFLYIKGDTRDYYLPFVYAVVFSLSASLLVSFGFLPLVSRYVRRFPQFRSPRLLERVLRFLIRRRWVWLGVTLLMLGGSVWLFITRVPHRMFERSEPDRIARVRIITAPGARAGLADAYVRKLEEPLLNEDVEFLTSVTQGNASISVTFPEDTDEYEARGVVGRLMGLSSSLGGAGIFVSGFGEFAGKGIGGAAGGHTIRITGYDYQGLLHLAAELQKQMERLSHSVQNVTFDADDWGRDDVSQYTLAPTGPYAMRPGEVAAGVIAATQPARFTQNIGGEETNVAVYADTLFPSLEYTAVALNDSAAVPLTSLGQLTQEHAREYVSRIDKQYELFVHYSFNGAIKRQNKMIRLLKESFVPPAGYKVEFDYADYYRSDDRKPLVLALLAALALVYLSIAALFESFKLPAIIFLSVPLAFIGVSVLFWLTGMAFAGTALVGLILLVGIAVNDSIMTLHHVEYLRNGGAEVTDAIVRGVSERVRPVMMTTLTTIGGLAPMLVRTRTDESFWQVLALTTIGGLAAGTFFVLFFLPVAYYLMRGRGKRRGDMEEKPIE